MLSEVTKILNNDTSKNTNIQQFSGVLETIYLGRPCIFPRVKS